MSTYWPMDDKHDEKWKVLEGQKLCDAIECAVDGHDYDTGEVEAANASARNLSEVLARLILCLYENKVISQEDVGKIIDPGTLGYNEKGNWKWPKKA